MTSGFSPFVPLPIDRAQGPVQPGLAKHPGFGKELH